MTDGNSSLSDITESDSDSISVLSDQSFIEADDVEMQQQQQPQQHMPSQRPRQTQSVSRQTLDPSYRTQSKPRSQPTPLQPQQLWRWYAMCQPVTAFQIYCAELRSLAGRHRRVSPGGASGSVFTVVQEEKGDAYVGQWLATRWSRLDSRQRENYERKAQIANAQLPRTRRASAKLTPTESESQVRLLHSKHTLRSLASLLPREPPSCVGQAGPHVNSSVFLRHLPCHASDASAPIVRQGVSGLLRTLSAFRCSSNGNSDTCRPAPLCDSVLGSAPASTSVSASASTPVSATVQAPASVLAPSAWFVHCHEARSGARCRLFSVPLTGWLRLAPSDALIKLRPWAVAGGDARQTSLLRHSDWAALCSCCSFLHSGFAFYYNAQGSRANGTDGAMSEFVDRRALQFWLRAAGRPSIALPQIAMFRPRYCSGDNGAANTGSFSTDALPQADQRMLTIQLVELARCLSGDTRWRYNCLENTHHAVAAAAAATPLEPKDAFEWYVADRGEREPTPALHAEWREHRAEVREQYEHVAKADLARYELQCTDAAFALESQAACQRDADAVKLHGQEFGIGQRGDLYCLPSTTGDKIYARYCETQHSLIIVYPNASVVWHSPSRSALPPQALAPAQQHGQADVGEPNHRQMFAVWSNWRWLYRFSQFGQVMEDSHDAADAEMPEHLKRVRQKRKASNEAHTYQHGYGKRGRVFDDSPNCSAYGSTCPDFIGVSQCEGGWLARARHPEHATVGYDLGLFTTAERAQQRIAAFRATAAQGHAARAATVATLIAQRAACAAWRCAGEAATASAVASSQGAATVPQNVAKPVAQRSVIPEHRDKKFEPHDVELCKQSTEGTFGLQLSFVEAEVHGKGHDINCAPAGRVLITDARPNMSRSLAQVPIPCRLLALNGKELHQCSVKHVFDTFENSISVKIRVQREDPDVVIMHLDGRCGLGLVLSEHKGMAWAARVHEFALLDDGSTGAIELSGRVTAGDAVLEVNGRSMRCKNYDFVLSTIRENRDALTIAFGPPIL